MPLSTPLDLNLIQQEAGITALPKDIGGTISKVLPYVFGVAGILLLLYLLFGGLQLMFAGGDPKKVQAAWGKITNAVIGFVIVFLSYWITQLFGELLNVQIIKDIFQ